MQTRLYLLLSAWLIVSCAPVREMSNKEKHMPSIGDIGKHSKSLVHSTFHKVGTPSLKNHIALSVMEFPFTKSKFKKYLEMETAKGKKPRLTYVDSLPNKPKYLCVEIADKIGIKEALNNAHNSGVKTYLENDDQYTIITKIAVTSDKATMTALTKSDALSLIDNRNGNITLELLKGQDRSFINLSTMEVFDYEVSGFCWGETKYGKKQIEALSSNGESCPRGTEKKAYKLDNATSFLKL